MNHPMTEPAKADDLVRDAEWWKCAYENCGEQAADTITALRAQLAEAEEKVEHWSYTATLAMNERDAAESSVARTRKALEDIASEVDRVVKAVEAAACHQEQCDMDGVMVKVSRQAVDEIVGTIEAVNTIARAALQPDGESK